MYINVRNDNCDAYFDGIGNGECFLYNGAYYIAAYDEMNDEYFGVNLATGATKAFDSSCKVKALTATVSFKEIQ